jgi:hypothetical protein
VVELVARYEQLTGERDEAEREREEHRRATGADQELYKWGDLTREAYLAERDGLERQLAGLGGARTGRRCCGGWRAFLRDLPAAWAAATPEQRNALARTVFQAVEIRDDLVTAVVPQPEFAPLFNLLGTGRDQGGNGEGQPVRLPRTVKVQL